MEFNDYQAAAKATAVYHELPNRKIIYPTLGLAGETGEVVEKVKKFLRDAVLDKEALKREMGDVLWYLAALAGDLGFTLDEVAQANLDKLQDRKARDKLRGEGDWR